MCKWISKHVWPSPFKILRLFLPTDHLLFMLGRGWLLQHVQSEERGKHGLHPKWPRLTSIIPPISHNPPHQKKKISPCWGECSVGIKGTSPTHLFERDGQLTAPSLHLWPWSPESHPQQLPEFFVREWKTSPSFLSDRKTRVWTQLYCSELKGEALCRPVEDYSSLSLSVFWHLTAFASSVKLFTSPYASVPQSQNTEKQSCCKFTLPHNFRFSAHVEKINHSIVSPQYALRLPWQNCWGVRPTSAHTSEGDTILRFVLWFTPHGKTRSGSFELSFTAVWFEFDYYTQFCLSGSLSSSQW